MRSSKDEFFQLLVQMCLQKMLLVHYNLLSTFQKNIDEKKWIRICTKNAVQSVAVIVIKQKKIRINTPELYIRKAAQMFLRLVANKFEKQYKI